MDVLASFLGIPDEDADSLRRLFKSLSIDMPRMVQRIEQIEIVIKAQSYYMQTKDPVLWATCVDKARLQIQAQNQALNTTIRKGKRQ